MPKRQVKDALWMAAFALSLASSCSQTNITSSQAQSDHSATTTLHAASHSTHIVLESRFPAPELAPVILDGSAYLRMSMRDVDNTTLAGAPALPVARHLLAVPQGTMPVVTILEEDFGPWLLLDKPLSFDEREEIHDGNLNLQKKDVGAYLLNYGETATELGQTSYAGHQQVAWLTVNPVQYEPTASRYRVRHHVKVAIDFAPDSKKIQKSPVVSATGPVLSRIVLNKQALVQSDKDQHLVRHDLIIAHESYREEIARLVQIKTTHGRETTVQFIDGQSGGAVKQMVRDAFATTAYTNLLFVGSIDQIPSFQQHGIWTDLPYALLDRGDVPDISVGRIPAQSSAELNRYLGKLEQRLADQSNREGFLLTAGQDASLGCPANVDRIGNILSERRESAQVTKLYKVNGASQEEIIDAYNANPNIVVYDGHGDQDGMTEIPFLIRHLPQLSNGTLPIILDIACLNAHWPSNGATRRNFAESILLLDTHGAAGIVAAGGYSGGHSFFRSMITYMVEGRGDQQDGEEPAVLDEIGRIVFAAKVASSYNDNYMFNYYGDPAISIFE